MDPKTIAYYQSLAREPSLASQLPVVFANGERWTVEQLRARCQFCTGVFPDDRFTGRLTPNGQRMVQLDALGYCPACRKVTPCHYRLYDDQRFEGKNAQGTWTVWTVNKPSWWQRARKALAGPRRRSAAPPNV